MTDTDAERVIERAKSEQLRNRRTSAVLGTAWTLRAMIAKFEQDVPAQDGWVALAALHEALAAVERIRRLP
jgi:hypothetical protein